jgi:hypothetical protein
VVHVGRYSGADVKDVPAPSESASGGDHQ